MNTLYNLLLSSTGDGLSLRIKAFLTGIFPIVIIISNLTGHPIIGGNLDELSNAIVQMVAGFGAIVSGGFFVFGWIRATFFSNNQLGKYAPH